MHASYGMVIDFNSVWHMCNQDGDGFLFAAVIVKAKGTGHIYDSAPL